ncbi:hypothetical protein C8J56DRAFT_1039240 [Mycena floridula]|nr:hypothetical protein C8J56DRAFT_1039240 [Mycena floridula]
MLPTGDIEMGLVKPELEGMSNRDLPAAQEASSTNVHLEGAGIVPEMAETRATTDRPTRSNKLYLSKRPNHRPWGEHLPEIKDDCWDNVMVVVNRYDDAMVKDWNNDIDAVLIFAGLFSAVVTAFVTQSYTWLSEGPSDKMVRILSQLSQHLGTMNTSPEDQKLFQHFPQLQQSFALRQLRYQSWNTWKVSRIIATLPLLLEFALVLFFAGVLDLIFPLNPIIFALASATVALIVLFLVITTFAPALYVWWRFFRFYNHLQDIPWHNLNPCAFKSPQSLIVLQILYPSLSLSFIFQLPSSLRTSSWVEFEGWILDRPSRYGPPAYLHRGLRWLVTNLRDNVAMAKNVLHCIDSEVTTSDAGHPEVPLASYVTESDEYPPDYATLIYLHAFRNDPEFTSLCMELFIRWLEEDGQVPIWLRIPASLPSDAQADRLLAVAKMKVQSQDFNRATFGHCLATLSVLWRHPSPETYKSVTSILDVIVQHVQKGPSADSGVWFLGFAWEWFHMDDITPEFAASRVFHDFFLWAQKLAANVNDGLPWD